MSQLCGRRPVATLGLMLWTAFVFFATQYAARGVAPTAAPVAVVASHDDDDDAAPGRQAGGRASSKPTKDRIDCVCPQMAMCTDSDVEQRCIEYLSNYSNIRRMTPMLSTLRFGRTAKLRAVYKDPCVEAVIKMPQSLFPNEPYGEYVAFEVDRLFNFGNVPPTSFVFVPIADIEAASASFKNGMKDSELAKHNLTSHTYAQWLSKEVIGYSMRKGLVLPHPGTGAMVLGCSVQLFIRSARSPLRTVFQQEEAYGELLRYDRLVKLAADPEGDFTPKKGLQLAGEATQLLAQYKKRYQAERQLRRVRNDEDGGGGGKNEDEDGDLGLDEAARIEALADFFKKTSRRRREGLQDLLKFMSDTVVFDSVIGNDDRGPIKNAHIYTVKPHLVPQECRGRLLPSKPAWGVAGELTVASDDHIAPLWLDQGKSFYKQALLTSALVAPALNIRRAVCVFRRQTVNGVRTLRGGALQRKLEAVVPPELLRLLKLERVAWASQRVDTIHEHMQMCTAAFGGEARALVWDD